MKIIYCGPGQDPMTVARTAKTQRSHSGKLRDLWIIPAIVAFLVIGVTVGPLKGCLPEKKTVTEQQEPSLVSQPVNQVTQEPVYCTLPTNEKLCDGCMNGVAFADKFITYRCDHGELEEVKSITTTTQAISR